VQVKCPCALEAEQQAASPVAGAAEREQPACEQVTGRWRHVDVFELL
jgi:hypothetical protein